MSRSSLESNLAQFREALSHLNTQFFLIISERREISLKIQEMKEKSGQYSHFDPEREKLLFSQMADELKSLSIKELLSFSLVMEDQAMALAPGSYPAWSSGIHMADASKDLLAMVNPLLLKVSHPEVFNRLSLKADFSFLKEL